MRFGVATALCQAMGEGLKADPMAGTAFINALRHACGVLLHLSGSRPMQLEMREGQAEFALSGFVTRTVVAVVRPAELQWEKDAQRQDALAVALSLEIQAASLQQISQPDNADQFAVSTCAEDRARRLAALLPALDHGKARKAGLGHALRERAQGFIGIRHHRIRVYYFRQRDAGCRGL